SSIHVVAVAEASAGRRAAREARGRGEAAAAAGDPTAPGARARPCAFAGGACALKKSHPVLGRAKADVFAFIDTQRGEHGVTRLCAVYGVTRAGYYAWRQRPESAHAAQDRDLQQRIQRLFQQHRGTYGSPRIHRALQAEGCAVSRRRVARLMRAAGAHGPGSSSTAIAVASTRPRRSGTGSGPWASGRARPEWGPLATMRTWSRSFTR